MFTSRRVINHLALIDLILSDILPASKLQVKADKYSFRLKFNIEEAKRGSNVNTNLHCCCHYIAVVLSALYRSLCTFTNPLYTKICYLLWQTDSEVIIMLNHIIITK